jgi:hypothetical protein
MAGGIDDDITYGQGKKATCTVQQDIFVKAYLASLGSRGALEEAKKQAGYSEKTNASNILATSGVQRRIREIQRVNTATIAPFKPMGQEYYKQQHLADARAAREKGDIAGANRATELAGKIEGIYVDKSVTANIALEPLTEAQERLLAHERVNRLALTTQAGTAIAGVENSVITGKDEDVSGQTETGGSNEISKPAGTDEG